MSITHTHASECGVLKVRDIVGIFDSLSDECGYKVIKPSGAKLFVEAFERELILGCRIAGGH